MKKSTRLQEKPKKKKKRKEKENWSSGGRGVSCDRPPVGLGP